MTESLRNADNRSPGSDLYSEPVVIQTRPPSYIRVRLFWRLFSRFPLLGF